MKDLHVVSRQRASQYIFLAWNMCGYKVDLLVGYNEMQGPNEERDHVIFT